MSKPYPKKEELLEIIKNDEALVEQALEIIAEDEQMYAAQSFEGADILKIMRPVLDFQRAMVLGGSIDYGATARDGKGTPLIRVMAANGFDVVRVLKLTRGQKKLTRDFIRPFGKIISFGCHDWLKLTKPALDKLEKTQQARTLEEAELLKSPEEKEI